MRFKYNATKLKSSALVETFEYGTAMFWSAFAFEATRY